MADGSEPDLVATFHVTRGSFTIPAWMLADGAGDGEADDWELRRLFARNLPEHDERAVLNVTRHAAKDGSAVVSWRRIVTHYRQA